MPNIGDREKRADVCSINNRALRDLSDSNRSVVETGKMCSQVAAQGNVDHKLLRREELANVARRGGPRRRRDSPRGRIDLGRRLADVRRDGVPLCISVLAPSNTDRGLDGRCGVAGTYRPEPDAG